MSSRSTRYSAELRDRAVRKVTEVRTKHPSEWAAINAVASEFGISSPNTLRRWIRQSESGENSNKKATSPKAHLLKTALLRPHPIVIGVAVTVLGGLLLAYFQVAVGMSKHHAALKIDAVNLSPGTDVFPKTGHARVTPFKIDIKLLNTGTQLAAINDARLIIQTFAKVPQCASQGSFGVSGRYGKSMPTDPQPGTLITIPVSQLVKPDGADRFDLLLRVPTLPGELATTYLYRVHLYLDYNTGSNAVDVGEILIGLPYYPDSNDGYFWTRYFAAHPNYLDFEGKAAAGIQNCLVRNSLTLKRLLSLSGRRTSAVSAIPNQLALCCARKGN
jgi:transposase